MTRQERHDTFRRECEEAGFEVEEYNGRNFYKGPAVEVEDRDAIQDVIRATTVKVIWDNLGLGYIVYPG